MSLKFIATLLLTFLLMALPVTNTVYSDSTTTALNVCQELVNQSRAYQSRATWHTSVAQSLKQQIQAMAKQPQTPAQIQAMDNLFEQYDQNRQLATQLTQLFHEYSDQAQQCMKSQN
ncbi:MAG: hypothetical protein ACP5VS_13590 [Desulfomonilaceae bacterium]